MNSVQTFVKDIPGRGGGRGRLRKYVFGNPLKMLDFLLYPCKFQAKQSFTPRNSTKLCYTLRNSMFLFNPRKLHLLFLQWLLEISYLQLPPRFIVCTPLSAGGWASYQIFKKREGLTTFRGGCWERGGDFFQEGLQFSHKK